MSRQTNDSPVRTAIVDGNEAAASIAYRASELIAIYPITPASPMGELADSWAAHGQANLWGLVPDVVEMQSEGGAAGAVHGGLQAGALATSFTASQGLLLMIPNMYKIAGELTPFVLHVAARTVATHALSIFADHSDVMAARQTGFAMLAASSVQEAHDMAAVAHAATLQSRIPFLHFFDGFRTSHELQQIEVLDDETLQALLDPDSIENHRKRALTPDQPVLRGTAQNPDTFFQAREAANRYYDECPNLVRRSMSELADRTGRHYDLFEYTGHPEADHIVVAMGSGAETVIERVEQRVADGDRIGVVKVRLYRPFVGTALVQAIPESASRVGVLDRCKEPGAPGDPLFLDVVAALHEHGATRFDQQPEVIGGRFGLSSKEFHPGHVDAVFANLGDELPKKFFTVGIVDDVTHTSLPESRWEGEEHEGRTRAVFYGLGSDGTVSANKNTIKILGEETELEVQGYFVYDSKKAGAVTVSHLRFGDHAIRSPYLIRQADFVACHQFSFLNRLDILDVAAEGGVFLLNAPFPADQVWDALPLEVQQQILGLGLRLHVIDAYRVAAGAGLGPRINTVMQTAFFALAGILPFERAIECVREAVVNTYGKRGPVLVERNHAAIEATLGALTEVDLTGRAATGTPRPPIVSTQAPDFVQKVTAVMLAQKGDHLPVSAFPVDGTWPTGTSQWEKRAIAPAVPLWDPGVCIQCNQCVLVCPHAAIRAKAYAPEAAERAPESFLSTDYRAADLSGNLYTIQVAPEDCTGCRLCVEVCPAKDRAEPRRKAINMHPLLPVRERERENYEFFLELPELDFDDVPRVDAKGSQFLQPLFEYSGACAGCGETPYIKLLTQLFGDRLLIANSTGCSSIYGGNLPTTPYTVNDEGRGPAWSNSLFEDNAEFGLGMRMAVDSNRRQAQHLLNALASELDGDLVSSLAEVEQDHASITQARQDIERLRQALRKLGNPQAQRLATLADYLVPKSVWLIGGDGWAYDIGYGGLDHVLALGRDINVLVLDTEVYSNTGGQQSKATPLGAAAKFAALGKEVPKKDLGMEAMAYGHVYVAQVAFGAKFNQVVEVVREAESYPGPSLVIAYSPCIAHGYDLSHNVEQQKRLVASGLWPLYRFDPRRIETGEPPLVLDSKKPSASVASFTEHETRFRIVERQDRDRYRELLDQAQEMADQRWRVYEQLAGITYEDPPLDNEQPGEEG